MSPFASTTWLPLGRFPFHGRRLGQDLALVNAVQGLSQLDAGTCAEHVAADLLEERELLRACIERNKVDLHGAFALPENVPRDLLRTPAAGVFPVGHDEKILAKHACRIEVRARPPQRLADGRASTRARQPCKRVANLSPVVRF